MTTRNTEHGTFTITRTYPVPSERVFAAWSSQGAKARWFGAPGTADYALDFRVGGSETNRGGPPGGPVYSYDATYQDIVPDQRIVYGYTMHADDDADLGLGDHGGIRFRRLRDDAHLHRARRLPRRRRHARHPREGYRRAPRRPRGCVGMSGAGAPLVPTRGASAPVTEGGSGQPSTSRAPV